MFQYNYDLYLYDGMGLFNSDCDCDCDVYCIIRPGRAGPGWLLSYNFSKVESSATVLPPAKSFHSWTSVATGRTGESGELGTKYHPASRLHVCDVSLLSGLLDLYDDH